MSLDFTRCRKVWVPDESESGGFWSPVFEYVKEAVRQIIAHPYFLLADDMGLSKSASALIAAQFLHDDDVIDRVIIVSPAAVRPLVWFDQTIGQIGEHAFDDKYIRVSEFHRKIRQWSRGPKDGKELRIIVSSYEYLRTHWRELVTYCGPKTLLILDESSAVRGPDSDQTDAMMCLRWQTNKKGRPVLGLPRCGRILEMNGTPNAESPMDMFSQGNLLHPDILQCRYKTMFQARYAIQALVLERGKPMLRYGRVVQSITGWSEEGIRDIQKRFAPYVLRREAKDVGIDFALDPIALEVALTPTTWKHYVSMRDQMVVWLESGVVAAHQAGVKTMRLAQITSGFLGGVEDANVDDASVQEDLLSLIKTLELNGGPYTLEDIEAGKANRRPGATAFGKLGIQPVQEIGREKLDFALAWHADLLKQHPDLKLLTWCRFVDELRRYLKEERLTFPSIPVGAACGEKILDGEHSKREERDLALRMLHPTTAPQGACTVGATQGTGAMGLNFAACQTVLDMSYDFSPWKKKQGDARVNRKGQTGPVSFFYLVAVGPRGQKTIDHHIFAERTGKMKINDLTTSGWVKMLEEE